jgi:hypothetical protein
MGATKWKMCRVRGKEMPLKYSELDRKNAADGYTQENTELVQAKCHQDRQAAKSYSDDRRGVPPATHRRRNISRADQKLTKTSGA